MDRFLVDIKTVVAGDANCKKTEFACKIAKPKNDDYPPKLGIEFFCTRVSVNNIDCEVQIWDTAGSENFRSVIRGYYRDCWGAFILYNSALPSTFDSIPSHIKDIRELSNPNAVIMIIGNKCNPDDPILVPTSKAESFDKKENLLFRQVSTCSNEDIRECLQLLVEEISKSFTFQMTKLKMPTNIS